MHDLLFDRNLSQFQESPFLEADDFRLVQSICVRV